MTPDTKKNIAIYAAGLALSATTGYAVTRLESKSRAIPDWAILALLGIGYGAASILTHVSWDRNLMPKIKAQLLGL